MPAIPEDLERPRQSDIDEFDVVLRRDQIDLNEDREIIQERRHDRRDDDLRVRNFQHFRHQERGRAHDRRHELAAGGGNGLDRSRIPCRIAGLAHQRDGHDSRCDDVGDRRAGNRPEQGRGNDRDFGGTAAAVPDGCHGEIGEKLPAARLEQYLTEKDKHHDDRRAHLQRNAEQSVRIEAHVHSKFPHLGLCADELTRDEMAERRIDDENQGYEKHDIAGGTAQPFKDKDHQDRADTDRKIGAFSPAEFLQIEKIRPDIKQQGESNDAQQNVVPGHAAFFAAVDSHRQEDNSQAESHDKGVVLLGNERKAEPFKEIDIPQQRGESHSGCEAAPHSLRPGLHSEVSQLCGVYSIFRHLLNCAHHIEIENAAKRTEKEP